MSLRTARSLTLASLVAVGIGCNAENPDGTPTKLGTVEKKIEAGAEKVGHEIKDGAIKAADATGKAMENAGQKLETDGKAAVEKNLGTKAGEVVEGAGKVLEKGGDKLQDAAKKKN